MNNPNSARFEAMRNSEASRIGPLLGAIATVPAGALVIGKDAAPGAPLFALALALIGGAYVFWICADGNNESTMRLESGPLARVSEGEALRCSWATVLYGAASMLASIGGFVGMHSQLRIPITIELGFLAAMLASCLVVAHVAFGFHRRNLISAASEHEAAGVPIPNKLRQSLRLT